MSRMQSARDLSGLMKFANRSPWSEMLDEVVAIHLGPALEQEGLEPEALFDLIGADWASALWGCAFEDFLTQERESDGANIVDEYLKRRGWNETARSKAYMHALRHSHMSLYEVSEVVTGKSMKLRDLLQDGEPVVVQEHSATKTLVNWDRIATRVIEVQGRFIISGSLLPFNPESSAELIAAFKRIDAEAATGSIQGVSGTKPADASQLLHFAAPLFTTIWISGVLDALAPAGLPEIVNADGEDVVFHRIVFPIRKGATQKDIAAQLNAVPELEPAGPKFWNWLVRPDKKRKSAPRKGGQVFSTTIPDGSLVYANIALEGRKLILEVNSAKRAEKARPHMAGWLDGLVGEPLTEIQTLEQMLANEAARDEKPAKPDISPEEARIIVHDMMTRHYAQTLDEPVPSLGNKTPRALARTRTGRAKVAEWLKYLENGSTHNRPQGDPMASYDFTWIWQELALTDLRK